MRQRGRSDNRVEVPETRVGADLGFDLRSPRVIPRAYRCRGRLGTRSPYLSGALFGPLVAHRRRILLRATWVRYFGCTGQSGAPAATPAQSQILTHNGPLARHELQA